MSDESKRLPLRYFNPVVERSTREQISHIQWVKLQRLLRHAYDRSPFYRGLLDQASAQPDKIKSFTDFQKRVPIISKPEILQDQEANPPYGNRLCVGPADVVQVTVTGGTSGKGPEIHGLTARDVAVINLAYTHGCYWAGVKRGDTVADSFPVSMSAGGLWLYGSYVRQHVNLLSMGAYPTSTKLRYLKQFAPRVLTATPSYLLSMKAAAEAEFGWETSKDLPVEVILTATEAYTLNRAREIEEGWGAKLFEWYASTQRVFTATCEYGAVNQGERGFLHHMPHLVLLETLDPQTREPVQYGDEGEVVVTFLDMEASPLIRFAMGDKARLMPAEACLCGRFFDSYQCGSISRYDDMLKVKGVNFWPSMVDDVIFAVPEVANYAGTVTSREDGREEMLVTVEFSRGTSQETRTNLIKVLESRVQAAIGLRMTIQEADKPIPVSSDFQAKLRRWRDERVL